MGNDRPNRRSSRRRGRRRGKGNHQNAGRQSTGDQASREAAASVRLKDNRSLERLRQRVEEVAREVERLREENAALIERLQEAEERPVLDVEGAIVGFDDEPEVLRQKVASFIEAIDQYLDQAKANRDET